MNKITWQSPSNIALIKYWGKLPNQIPANPSISFTLDACHTTTSLIWKERSRSDTFDFEIYLDDVIKPDFKPKIETFFNRIEDKVPFLKDFSFEIRTSNSFPHSSGIASSASGLSALSLCITSLAKELKYELDTDFFQFASTLSRLGSGSACRSVYGKLAEWGVHKDYKDSSDLYAVPYNEDVHSIFETFQDYILLIDKGEKQVSSTAGHGLMNNHPFARERFHQANSNMSKMKYILKSGDLFEFGSLVESEALTLHSMMMTSMPYYLLFKPNTIAVIQEIWNFRKETNTHLYFTLDAGANVHLLFPKKDKQLIDSFVKERIVAYCKNEEYICDQVGEGPKQIFE